jgi:hypothetical protein
MSEPSGGASRVVILGATISILALCVFQAVWAMRTRDAIAETKASLESLKSLDRIEEKLDKLASDQDFLVDDIARLAKKVDGVVAATANRSGSDDAEAIAVPQIDWTQPQLFEKARTTGAEYGIQLTKDEVRVPARFVLRSGQLDFFAVLKGGKEYESVISVVGNTPPKERRPRDFGARLNNAILALGFKRGKPVRYSSQGTTPASGETIYVFVEWEEKGAQVLVRAEDLLWDPDAGTPMPRSQWIYVGSQLVKIDETGPPVFAADLDAEVIASYTSPATIIDNVSSRAGNNRAYLVATPRIPKDVDDCTLVIRRADREPTRTFPDPPPSGDTPPAGDAPKTPGAPSGQGR